MNNNQEQFIKKKQNNSYIPKRLLQEPTQQNNQEQFSSPIRNTIGSVKNQTSPRTPLRSSFVTPTKSPNKTPRIQNNNNPNKTPIKRPRSLFTNNNITNTSNTNSNINTFIQYIRANENLKNITKNSDYKRELIETKKKLLAYLQKSNNINITNIENTVVSKKNIESNTRGTSSIVFYCIYNNKLAVIKILDNSERSRNEIEITKYLAKKGITPEVYKDGQLTVDNISYLYFITERYDGDPLNIKQKMSDTITRDDIKGEIKNELYSKFHNLLKLKGYYLLHDDISPTNFVFKNNRDGTYTFKLVDFDRIILVDITDAYHGSELLKIDGLLNKIRL